MEEHSSLHVVVFPWLAFGHMLPFLELSKALATRGHHISYISTQRNIQRLPKIPLDLSKLIDFVPLPLPPTEGLPKDAEATSDIPPGGGDNCLRKAFGGLEQHFATFVQECNIPKPDWLILDFAHNWKHILPIAAEFDIPCMQFSTANSASLAFLGPIFDPDHKESRTTPEDWTVSPPWISFPSTVAYRPFEARKMFQSIQGSRSVASDEKTSGDADSYRHKQPANETWRALAVRSSTEVESKWLIELKRIYKKPVFPVGLLVPNLQEEIISTGDEVMEWLDKQKPGSVVYVALGSEATLSVELMHELALGLELSELPFLWALRKPADCPENTNMLPDGFQERISKDRRMVAFGWVPQLKILSHGSIGGFLTHAGWSSIIESLHFGHPLVLLPIALDQGLNARVMVERGIGIEIERDEDDGSFTKESVAKALRLIMVLEQGKTYKKQAKEMKEEFSDVAGQEKYVDELNQYLLSIAKSRQISG